MLALNRLNFRGSTQAGPAIPTYVRPMHKTSIALTACALGIPATASASTLTPGPVAVLDSKPREISIAASTGGIYALPQDRARGVLRRYDPATLTAAAGWKSPFVIKGRTTGFAFQQGFVAAAPPGDVIALDPNRGRLVAVDGKTGARQWQVSTNRIDRSGYALAAGELAVDADNKIYVRDTGRGGLVRFSRRGKYEGVRKLAFKDLIRRIDIQRGRIALLAGGSSGGATKLALAGTAGAKPPRSIAAVATGRGEFAVDLDIDSKGRPRVLISSTAQKRIDTFDPFTGAVVDSAVLPVAAGQSPPRFLELDARDRPVVSDANRLTIYDVEGAP